MAIALRIGVSAASEAEADRLTSELESILRTQVDVLSVHRVKADLTSMDAGSILIALLAAPAIVELARGPATELAKGIADWLRKRRANISIGSDGSVTVENVRPEDVEQLVMNALAARRDT